ncbi:pyridoxamine 5'-phosphate oxidase family protein [Actinoplanes sp. NPDC026619]|uniref:pyridoxamine 5'-phosphate oxidase family protein n=1 Tax=Actinoplanes sp. NPDC026619 TaxID=3155798 RepID=UPI0033E356B6
MSDLTAMVRSVVDDNRYMTLGTVEPDGLPRLTPVYFTHDGYRSFYWVSEPGSQHSRNLAREPRLSIVIFDSRRLPGAGEAVYLSATARQVPDEELAAECEIAFRDVGGGAEPFAPEELCGGAELRLYRADITSYAVHIRGGDPDYGTGVDKRMTVVM